MKYHVWKLKFAGDVHFGSGGLNTCENIVHADTVFSALCVEAVRRDQKVLDRLIAAAREDRLRFSDALPYIGDQFYIPKPMVQINAERTADSIQKKAMKKLEYIPVTLFQEYMNGRMDIKKESDFFSEHLGAFRMIEKAAVTGREETVPYGVQVFRFADDSGLYLCCAYEDEETLNLVMELLDSLGFSGLGGELSSGLGRFSLYRSKPTETKTLISRLGDRGYQRYLSLSISLPCESELERLLTSWVSDNSEKRIYCI
jgi:CRISPR-associated protein Csm4